MADKTRLEVCTVKILQNIFSEPETFKILFGASVSQGLKNLLVFRRHYPTIIYFDQKLKLIFYQKTYKNISDFYLKKLTKNGGLLVEPLES